MAACLREANRVLKDSDSTLIQVRALESLATRS
jgi:hypothetical protein